MKKAKNRLIAILLLFLLSSSSFILYNNVENGASNSLIQDMNSPKLSNPGKSLLHSYDFEDETIGQDPTYESLTIDESSGDVYIDNLSDGQQKHLALHKVGTSGRVWVRDNFSRFGETYTAGEYHLKVYHDASGFGINLNSANGEAILAMVWWNGEIKDDVYGTVLATYAYDQWLDVVIYFNLSLGWMFDLEGVRYGAGYSFSFFGAFTANSEHIWITSFVSGGGDGYFRVDDISFYYETENLINIFTPESKEYRKPMDGYYPGTYGFENDVDGSFPDEWEDHHGAHPITTEIISEFNEHKKVIRAYDGGTGAWNLQNQFNITEGTVEFYWAISTIAADKVMQVGFLNNSGAGAFGVGIIAGQIRVDTIGGWYNIPGLTTTTDTWDHVRIDYRTNTGSPYKGLNQNEFTLYYNGVDYGTYSFSTNMDPDYIRLYSGYSQSGMYGYYDAIGYSWDPNYNIGDNLNDGLLLSYENSTSLDWVGYSLDGQNNKTILGNATIPIPEEGIHSIQVFGNDSLGDMYQSDLRHFTVDFPIDIITPETKTYEKGMSGYYPATFGFEETKTDTLPSYCNYVPGGSSPDGPGSYAKVIDNWTDGAGNTHKKVLKMYDRTSSGTASGTLNFTEEGSEICRNSTIEFWACNTLTGVYYHSYFEIWGDLGNMVSFEWDSYGTTNDPEVRITPATGEFGTGVYHEWNRWYRYSIDISCDGGYAGLGANEFRFRIYDETGTLIYTSADLDLKTAHPTGGPYRYHVLSTQSQSDVSHYLDGFGITSMYDNYIIGDNLNEGLLLSYENSTTLDWQGYSLDNQQNKTILGDTAISMPEDGIHNIQVFGETLGTRYQSDKRYFTVDFPIDIITPEAKIYEKGMSGYYPGTFGFEDVLDDTTPTYVEYNTFGTSPDWVNSYTRVINSKTDGAGNKHNKVLLLKDATSSALALSYLNFTDYGSEIARNSTFEFYHLLNIPGTHYISRIALSGNYGDLFQIFFETNSLVIKYINNSGIYSTGLNLVRDRWYRYSIDISCDEGYAGLSANQFRFRIYDDKGILIFTSYDMDFTNSHPTGGPNRITMVSSETQTQEYQYLDAFSITGLQDGYEIGDNMNEGLLLSYENSTALDWQGYSLDGQPTITIMGNTTIPLPTDGTYSIRVFGNDSIGSIHQSNVRRFSVYHINIITPEEKIYTDPMSGYYPGIYGFECDENDNFPKGWIVSSSVNGYAKVIDGIDGHNKVLECYSSSLDDSRVATYTDFAPQEQGSFEFWWYKSSSYTSAAIVDFWGETLDPSISIRVDHWPSADNNEVQYQTGAGYLDTGYPYYTDNKWMHFRIDFNCSSDTYSLWIDQVKYLDNIDFINSIDETGINQMRFDSYNAGNAVLYYVDAVSFSWDIGYSVGDNLNEGLLLSYENSTALDWQGYSLDGQAIKTILGNATIPVPNAGAHNIRVFANDSFGTNYQSDIRYFSVNTTQSTDQIAPVIVINLPGQNALFGSGAPSYDITVIELNLNTMWYTLDWGLINTTITQPTGTIDQTLWNNRPNGTVDIRFYADDIAGNVGFEDITVRKDILPPQITITNPIQNQLFDDTAPSFDLTISEGNLDARWYSLDGGVTVMQFIGFAGTINQTEWDKIADGTATITFYANDTLNNLGFNEVSVRKDTIEPQITINSPNQNQIFYEEAPSFVLTIDEENLDAIWYTLDDGLVIFLCGTSGNINNLYWNAIPPGFYTLEFYANDTLGNIGFSEVTIKKEDPAIPGYNPFVLSLILLVGILGISLKIKKKTK